MADIYTVTGTEGADTLKGYSNSFVQALGGEDSITNSGSSVTIDAGSGNDYVDNTAISVMILGGDGNDIISNKASNVTVNGDAGNDIISNKASIVTVDGGADNDSITNSGAYVKIYGKDGDDSISNTANNVTVNGGKGADFIANAVASVTIEAGTGNDSISLGADAVNNIILYYKGDGNDLIRGFNSTTTLQIDDGEGTFSTAKNGNDIIVMVGEDQITLVGAATLETVNIEGEDETQMDAIYNSNANTLVSGDIGNDTISNSGASSTLNAGDGDDYITNWVGGTGSSISAGDGDDYVKNTASNVTIKAGAGNDTIDNQGDSVLIEYSAGNDLITGFNETSTLKIGGEIDTYSTQIDGDDVIVTVGDNSLTLQGAAELETINIIPDPPVGISNTIPKELLAGGSGNDDIANLGANVTISGGAGNDKLWNDASSVSIDGGEGNDSIVNYGDSVTIDGGADKDTITVNGVKVLVSGGEDNDTIHCELNLTTDGNLATLNGDTGNDEIINHGKNVTVNGGKGDDYLRNEPVEVTHYGNNGAVTVENEGGSNVLFIYAEGDGNDYIDGFNETSTLQIGDGTGTYSKEIVDSDVIITVGDGKITLAGKAGSTLNILGEEVLNLSIVGTEGDNNINNTLEGATIQALGGNDTITNSVSNVTIDGGKGNDNISNNNDEDNNHNVSIAGGAGSDIIRNNSGSKVTIDGGEGNDSIDNSGSKASILGGAGTDTISNSGSNVTILGGTGDDSIVNNGGANVLFKYTKGDGNDLIEGFNATSTLDLGNGTEYSTSKSGSDIIVEVDTGKTKLSTKTGSTDLIAVPVIDYITLKGAAGLSKINILPKEEALMTINKTAKVNLTGTGNDDVVYNYANTVTIKGGDGNDLISTMRKTTSAKLYGEAGDDTLEAYSATKALLNGGEGNDEIYSNGKQSTIIGGTGDDSIEVDSTSTQIQYANGDGNDVITGFDEDDTLKIGNGTTDTYYSEKSGDDVIVTVGDGKIILSGAVSLWDDAVEGGLANIAGTYVDKVLIIDDKTSSPVTLKPTIEIADASARTKAIKITGNALDNTILGGSGKDTLYGKEGNDNLDGGAGNDRLYGNEGDDTLFGGDGADLLSGAEGEDTLYGGTGNDTLRGGDDADLFIYSGGNDIIEDYGLGEDVISLGADITDAATSGDNVILTVGSGKLTIKNAKYKAISFIGANNKEFTSIFGGIKYYTDDSSATDTLTSEYVIGDASARTKAIKITGNALDNTVLGGSGKDTLYGKEGNDNLDGGAGNDRLYGNEGDDSLFGGDGADLLSGAEGEDTLYGGTGNDTLRGGDDADLFIYSGGNDIIEDYGLGEDVISLGADVTDTATSGDNVILTVGSGKLTIKDAKYKAISFIGADNKEFTTIFGGEVYTDDSPAKVTLEPDSQFATAETRTKAIRITGNALDNTILGGTGKDTILGDAGNDNLDGGAGNDRLYGNEGDDTLFGGDGADLLSGAEGEDTLHGGTGNDTLRGGDDADLFIYSDGNDIIEDYGVGDKISLGADITNTVTSGNNIVLKFGENSLTINNANHTEVSFIGADGKEYSTFFNGLKIDNNSAAVVAIGSGVDYVDATSRTTTLKLTANELNNTILGGSGKDSILGEEGKDSIFGNAGADTIYGGDGSDWLNGGAGADKLYGEEGDDTLIGGAGNDSLWGGDGSNTFVYASGDGNDTISGFGKNDMLQLDGVSISDIIVNTTQADLGKITFRIDDSNSITLANYTTNSFKINGSNYTAEGTVLQKRS